MVHEEGFFTRWKSYFPGSGSRAVGHRTLREGEKSLQEMIGGDRLLYPPRFSKVHGPRVFWTWRECRCGGCHKLVCWQYQFQKWRVRDLLNVLSAHWTRARNAPTSYIYIYIYIRLLEVVLALLFFSFFSTFIYFSYRALLLFNRAVNGFLNGTKIILRGVAGDGKIIIPLKFRFRRFSFFLLILSEYGTTNERWKKYYENCKISWESGKRTVWTNSLNRVMIIIIIIIIHKLHSLWKNSPG